MEKNPLKPESSEKDSSEQERLISFFEQNICPSCNKDTGRFDEDRWDGFCSEDCFLDYEKKNPDLINLTKASGEFNYRYSLSQDAKKLGMDVGEYRKLRESHLSYADIEKMKRKE